VNNYCFYLWIHLHNLFIN